MQVEVAFTNPLGDVPSAEVTYALQDAAGVRFYTGSEYASFAATGERFRVESDTLEELPASVDAAGLTCEVLAVEEGYGDESPAVPSASDTCQFVEVDSYGDVQIELSVINPFPQTENLSVSYALRGPEGVRFDESSTSVDLVAAGEAVRVSEDTLTSAPDWVPGDSITCSVLAVESSDF